jgi:D-methionine transport system ATP-binding protein
MGVTIIVITHEMKVVEQICNKVAVLDHGTVCEEGFVKDIFVAPKSATARDLIFPKREVGTSGSGRIIRLVFEGQSYAEPVVSALSIECKVAVNIMGADTKIIAGKAYGQMMIELPAGDDAAFDRIRNYLESHGVKYEEVV